MTSREFCYWLQGFFEITGKNVPLTAEQALLVQKHLNMVFHHEIDPSYSDAVVLNEIHSSVGDEPCIRC